MAGSFIEAAKSVAADLGYCFLKPQQELAISSFLEGNDVFVSLPTGYSKSLCYAALPHAFEKLARERPAIVIVDCVDEGPGVRIQCQGTKGRLYHQRILR